MVVPDRREYAVFDLLRFILASVVMLGHMGVVRWDRSGNLAVQVFFALSGWLIGEILLRTERSGLGRFYYNRSTRIWIPFYFTVAVLYVTSLLHEPHRSARWSEFLVYDITFTHNWFTLWPDFLTATQQMPLHGTGNHFWSLAVEEQFYLAAPLLMTLLPGGRTLGLWICVAAALYFGVTPYGSIGLGVLCAVIARRSPGWHLHNAVRAGLLLLAAAAAAAMVIVPSDAVYGLAAPPFAIAVVLLCATPMRRNALTRWLGGVSFPFYLNAWMGVFVLHGAQKALHLNAGFWYSGLMEFAVALAVCALTYELIDVRIHVYRDRLYRPAAGWIMCGAGYTLVITGVVFWLLAGPSRP